MNKKHFIVLLLCLVGTVAYSQIVLKQITGDMMDAVADGGNIKITVVKTGTSLLDIKWTKAFINSSAGRVYIANPNSSALTDLACNGLSRNDDATFYIFRINLNTLCTGSFFGTPYVSRDIQLGDYTNDLGKKGTIRLFIVDPTKFTLQQEGNFCPSGTVDYCVACGITDGPYQSFVKINTDKNIAFTTSGPGGIFGGETRSIDASTFGCGLISGPVNARAEWTFTASNCDWPGPYTVNTPSAFTKIAQINCLPTVSAGAANVYCDDSGTHAVTAGTPSGGTWSGSFIDASGNFNTNSAPSGSYTVTYTYTDANGCTNSANKSVTVNALPFVDAGSDKSKCDNSGSYPLGGSPTGGTWSGSTNLSGANFDTNAATSGTYVLTYTYTDPVTGCTNSDVLNFNVLALPTVSAGSDFSVCVGGGNKALTSGTPSGGAWSGPGVSGSTFNPVIAGVGTSVLTYTYSDGTCSNSSNVNVTVLSSPTVDAGSDLVTCSNSGLLTLSGGSPTGGTWSGTAVSSGQFDPSIGAGTYTITYSYTNGSNCTSTDTRSITVNAKPTVSAGNNFAACVNSADIDLVGSPSGGTWSGTGIVGPTKFSPSTAGAGTFTLSYTYTNSNSCTATSTLTATVNSVSTFSIGSDQTFCNNSGTYNLNNDLQLQYQGGTWSGNGISGINFNPSNVTAGAYTITYKFTNASGCQSTYTKQFTVVAGPSVSAGSTLDICLNGGIINLIGESPLGGAWSGPGVQSGTNKFDPTVPGVGTSVVTYTYTTPSCIVTAQKQIVIESPTAISAGPNFQVCSNAPDFLITGASLNGGVWQGSGVTGGFFSPTSVGAGSYTLTYVYTNGKGCVTTSTRTVTVNAAPTVNAGVDIVVCSNATVYNLIADVNITGGTFSGTGIQGLNFNPAIAGVGVHQITYSYTDPVTNCTASDFRLISVIAPVTVTAGGNLNACIDAPAITLTGIESLHGGIWSGNGVTAGAFTPAAAGAGNQILTYAVTDGNGCVASVTKQITVIAKPVISAGPDIFVCSGAPLVALNGTGQPIGGAFTGPFVTGGNFDVGSSGAGTFAVTYNYTDANGCSNTATKNIIVNGGASVFAGSDFSVCVGGPVVDLAGRVTPGGGTFTGTGVNGTSFNPANVTPGSYTITYSLANSYGCSGTDQVVITVNSLPTVNAGTDKTLCLNAAPFDLTATAFPSGGVFSGSGVIGTNFNASLSGIGDVQVYYTYTNASGCSTTASRKITVTDLPTVNPGPNLFMCVDRGLVDLSQGVTPSGGSWTGSGVSAGLFDPSVAGVGIQTVTYKVTQSNGCSNSSQKTIAVFSKLVIDAGPDVTVCTNGSTVNLNSGASVTGGTWTGLSVQGTNFTPGQVGPGAYQMSYAFTNQYGCAATDTKIINVINPQSVSIGSNITVCSTSSSINLATGVSPGGGVFSGSGVVGNTFTPSIAGVGDQVVTYTVTDVLGCQSIKTRTIKVQDPTAVDAGANQVVCLSSGLIDLDAGASVSGGAWSGAGVSGSFFSPQTAGVSTNVISYTYNSGNGCISTDTKTITVRPDITVDAGISRTLCINAGTIDLTNDPDKHGGTWTGSGLTNSTFDPTKSGVGSFVITYNYKDAFGCTANDTKQITVNDIPSLNAGPAVSICTTASPLNLNTAVFPTGGTWTGAGITGGFFNPQVLGSGSYNLNYKLTDANGCTNSTTKQVTVTLPQTISAGANKIICVSTGLYDLTKDVSVSGGTFTGTGVSNGQFDPAFAGLGDFQITYTYNNGSGCISVATRIITVKNDAVVSAGSDKTFCSADAVYDLTNDASLPGGTWSGLGVNGNLFNPSSVSAGIHPVKYSYTNAFGCSATATKNITVNKNPVVDPGPTVSVCTTAPAILLNNFSFPTPGTWSGPGVSNNIFNPGNSTLGAHTLNYSFTDNNGCVGGSTRTITVVTPPVVTIGSDKILCVNSGRVDLAQGISQLGGIWSGPGLEGGSFFNPALATIGNNVLTYTYDNGSGCISTAKRNIQVRSAVVVDAGPDRTFCLNSAVYSLVSDPSIAGGTWSGTGVTQNSFDASKAGAGSFILTYNYQDAFGCPASDTRTFTVDVLPTVTSGPDATVCTTASTIDLTAAEFPLGGNWTGPGVSNNSFNPQNLSVGVYPLTYSFTSSSGCTNTAIRSITIKAPPVISIGGNLVMCANNDKIDLAQNVSQIGGVWSGSTGIENGTFFNPAVAPVGTNVLTYTYNDGAGCISASSRTIVVRAPITVDAGIDLSFCLNSAVYSLTNDGSILGGTWSGPGVSQGNFDASKAGVGNVVLTYTYKDAFGCSALDTRNVTVNSIPTITAGPDATVCTTASTIDLTTAEFPLGGSWTGAGVSNNNFNPQNLSVGVYPLTYSYTSPSGCTNTGIRSFTVKAPPVINVGGNLVMCANSDRVDLAQGITQIGGVWSGSTGLENGSFFNPLIAPVGTNVLTYTYNDGAGCVSTSTKTIVVRTPITVDAGIDLAFCLNAPVYSLVNDGSILGGTWSGTGVQQNSFDPSKAGVGNVLLTYTYKDAFGCTAVDTRSVTINAIPTVTGGPPLTLCTTASAVDLTTGEFPGGGTWNGSGVNNNSFAPQNLGAGIYSVTYNFTSAAGCTNTATKSITVRTPPVVTVGNNLVMCANSDRIDLTQGVSQIGGTWSGSTGLENGSFFNPSLAPIGTNTLTYSYDDGAGCISTANKTIVVRSSITVDAGVDLAFCLNAPTYSLTNDGSILGGTWSGTGVQQNNFIPSQAGVGNVLLTYTYKDAFGCTAVDTRSVTINSIPTVTSGPDVTLCTTATPFDLTTAEFPAGGTWSGSGVGSNAFDPKNLGVGIYTVTYKYTSPSGCFNTVNRSMTVKSPDVISVGNNLVLCLNSAQIDLDLSVSKLGGTWSGPGLDGSYFDPSVAGQGTFQLTYTYNDGSGCISTSTRGIQVRGPITVDAGPDKAFCKNSSSYSLLNDSNIQGGSWSGTGVSGTNFSPLSAAIGTNIITYTYQNQFGCVATDSRVFTVSDVITVNAGPPISACINATAIDLTNAGFPLGGTWSGQGTTNNKFDPTSVGSGTYSVSYNYADVSTGCTGSATKQITVNDLPVVGAGSDFDICVNATPLTLSNGTPLNGSWSGTGVISGVFDPISAGLGSHDVTYSYTNSSNCTASKTIKVNVLAEPTLTTGSALSLCIADNPVNLMNDVSLKGGTFTGKGMTGSIFNPQDAGTGTKVITYTVRYNGCDLSQFRSITVNKPDSLAIGKDLTLCVAANTIDLQKDANIPGGTWSGSGVTGNTFDPAAAGLGSQIITYSFTNAYNCTSTATRVITVQQQLPIDAGADISLCSSVNTFDLSSHGNPTGGVFVGTGVTNNIFNPSASGLGSFTINYIINNGNGCVSTDQVAITVSASPITDFGKDSIVCITAQPITLNFKTDLLTGSWDGKGVVNNVFYPSLAGLGTNTLTYTNSSIACDIVGRRNLTVVGLPQTATSTMTSAAACFGDFITLSASVSPQDRATNATVAWFHGSDKKYFDQGEQIVYQVGVNEKVHYQAINQYGCTSGQADYVTIQTNNPEGVIHSSDRDIAYGKSVQFFADSLKSAAKFQWDFGDGLINYEQNPFHYYYDSGYFDIKLKLTSSSGCVTTVQRKGYIHVKQEPGRENGIVMGIEPTPGEKAELISFFPNPTNGDITVEINSLYSVNYLVKVVDIMGTITNLKDVFLESGYNKIRLPLESFTAGVYTVLIVGPADSFKFKVVKQ